METVVSPAESQSQYDDWLQVGRMEQTSGEDTCWRSVLAGCSGSSVAAMASRRRRRRGRDFLLHVAIRGGGGCSCFRFTVFCKMTPGLMKLTPTSASWRCGFYWRCGF